MNNSKREIPPRFVVPHPISPRKKRHVVQHKKFPKKLTITKKKMMHRLRAIEKRQLPEKRPQGKPKEVENLR